MINPSIIHTDPLYYIQGSLAEYLQALPYFSGIPILIADQGNIVENIKTAIGKIGLCIIIEPTTPTFSYSGASIVVDVPCAITVWELVITNRGGSGSRKRASEVVIEIVKALKPHQTPAPPAVVADAQLKRDSGGECVYTLTAKRKFAL
jgi:hypothetical protein